MDVSQSIINKKLDRHLRIIYCEKQSSFEELLEKDSYASIDEKNIQILATEIYKVIKGMSPPQITELFARRDEHSYNLRHNTEFLQPLVNSLRYMTSKRLLKNRMLKTVLPEFARFLSKI